MLSPPGCVETSAKQLSRRVALKLVVGVLVNRQLHIIAGHIVCALVEARLFPRTAAPQPLADAAG